MANKGRQAGHFGAILLVSFAPTLLKPSNRERLPGLLRTIALD